jgi:hypothetical protein
VLLVFGAPRQLRLLAGQEHGRTIPLTEVGVAWAAPHLWPDLTQCSRNPSVDFQTPFRINQFAVTVLT